MADFHQQGPITTLHDLGSIGRDHLESMLREATLDYRLGLILPVTASDMRAAPFENIVHQLRDADYIEHIVVVLGIAPEVADYQETKEKLEPLGGRAEVLWTDGPRMQNLNE